MNVIESQYLPPIEYFILLKEYDEITIDGFEYFEKQTYRNRCHILSANGVLKLTVPVRGVGKKIITSKVEIDYIQKWLNVHWRAITSAYNRSPFFEFYKNEIQEILFKEHQYIYDLNNEMLTFCLKVLQIDTKINHSKVYIEKEKSVLNDFRSFIHPKKKFTERNIYVPKPYGQVFGSKFAANLSVLDLLFCEGPNAGQYL